MSTYPPDDASASAVPPSLGRRVLGFAPASISSFTTSVCPWATARWSAVALKLMLTPSRLAPAASSALTTPRCPPIRSGPGQGIEAVRN